MTIRDCLNQHMRRSTISSWLMLPAAVIVLFATAQPVLRYTALVMAGICAASNIYHNFSARCPRCGTCLLLCVSINGILLRIPSWFNSCPSCGLSFDTPLDVPQRSKQSRQPIAGRSDI